MKSITETESHYKDLEKMDPVELLTLINKEDQKVATAITRLIPEIAALVRIIADRIKNGGRLFYVGAGTSGRLGVLDASEVPPTFGMEDNVVIGLMAGGDAALRGAGEKAEDDPEQAWIDLQQYQISEKDTLMGIAASGRTPYVLGALQAAGKAGLVTGCIVCNPQSPISLAAQYPIEIVVGPEFITGSTRMKAGTAQKLVLNMISSSVMILLGRVKGNKMVDMQLSNSKMVSRGIRMIMEEANTDEKTASNLLKKYGSIRVALQHFRST